MRLAPLILSLALIAPASTALAQDSLLTTAPVIQKERDMWQYLKERNLGPFREMLDPSYTSVTRYGIYGQPLDAGRFDWTSLEQYELSDFTARQLDTHTVLVTYKANLKGRALGNRVQGIYWLASVWKQENGDWKVIFHSEVKG
jgi:hypothetical protein